MSLTTIVNQIANEDSMALSTTMAQIFESDPQIVEPISIMPSMIDTCDNTGSVTHIRDMLYPQVGNIDTEISMLISQLQSADSLDIRGNVSNIQQILPLCTNPEQKQYVYQELIKCANQTKSSPITQIAIDTLFTSIESMGGPTIPNIAKQEVINTINPFITHAISQMPGSQMMPMFMGAIQYGLGHLYQMYTNSLSNRCPPSFDPIVEAMKNI